MKTRTNAPLACRLCRHYQFEGRRGGKCQKLGVPVKGEWSSCSLMALSFSKPSGGRPITLKLQPDHYISEIYSYETVAKLKSVKTRGQAKAS